MNINKFTTTTASMAPDSLSVAWLNDGLAWCECWSRVKLQWMT